MMESFIVYYHYVVNNKTILAHSVIKVNSIDEIRDIMKRRMLKNKLQGLEIDSIITKEKETAMNRGRLNTL